MTIDENLDFTRQIRLRYGLVILGLFVSEAIFLLAPGADANGNVPVFPESTLWLGSLLIAWGVLMTGMFTGLKGRKTLGPLILGMAGSAVLVLANL